MKRILMFVVAVATLTACCGENDKTKFNAKEYAERKTERLDKIVDLTDAQEKEVYSTYLAQGKEIKKNIKAAKKMCGEMKHPDCTPKAECKKAECNKAECDKANCNKAECNKAECDKANCNKAECKKAECKKAECDKAKCNKAECKKAECKKAECKKAECDKAKCNKAECKKAECDKTKCDKAECKKAECNKAKCDKAECNKAKCDKAECNKAECKKAECKKAECKPQHKGRKPHPNFVTPQMRKATGESLSKILTPEQNAKLKEHRAKRHNCCPDGKQCMPTPDPANK